MKIRLYDIVLAKAVTWFDEWLLEFDNFSKCLQNSRKKIDLQ